MLVFRLLAIGLLVGCTASEPQPKRVFLASVASGGNLGGLSGADARCQMRADSVAAAGVNDLGGSTWKAWLSDSNENAIDRIQDVGPWYLVDETTKVFNNKAHVALTPATGVPPIDMDEFGTSHFLQVVFVWTGTKTGGLKAAETCRDWTSDAASDTGLAGFTNGAESWTEASVKQCDFTILLYCFEQ